MEDDWDLSDSEESAVVPTGSINFFKKKEAIIELSAMIDRQKRPMTAEEIHHLFRHEFHQDFPHSHFGFSSMETFIDDIREIVHDGNLPDGTRLYIANPQYKYHLLRAMARGGGAADRTSEGGATAVVKPVQQPARQQMTHRNGGGFGFPSRGRRGMARRITPVANGSGPSRFSGVPKTPSHPPADAPVMPQVQQQQSREQQRDQEKGNLGPLERSAAEVVSKTVTARESTWRTTNDDQTSTLSVTKMEDVVSGDQEKEPFEMTEESEPCLVPMKGVNKIAEEKTLGGRRGVLPSVDTNSYLDDILDLGLSQPATENNRALAEIGNKEGNPMALEKITGSARDLMGVDFHKEAKEAPNVEPPRLAMQQSTSRNISENLPSEPVTSVSYNKKQSQFLQKKNIVSSSAAVQHEMTMGAQQTTMKTIAISSNFSVTEIAFEEAVEFLKMTFPAVGKKINVHFLCDTVLSVIEANPRHFVFGSDHNGREVVELLRPMVEALAKPEKPLLQAASLEDLTWMLEGKTVASEEEPFDLALIVYQTADVVVCASASFGVKNSFRLRAISEELKNRLKRKRMERAVSIRTGWMYVATHEEHLVRVIVVGQRYDDRFLAILVDGAGQVILKAYDDIWEVPAGCGIKDVPANIYLARHKAKKAFSEKLTDLIVSKTQLEMFFHSQRPRDGIRTADWLDFPHKSSWFSGENPLAVDAMKNAIKVRVICGYFDTELATPLAKMTPYSQRKKSSPNFVKEIFSPYREKVAAVVVRSQKDVEERREIAVQALGHFQGLMKQFAVLDEEVADAVKLYNDLHAEAFAR